MRDARTLAVEPVTPDGWDDALALFDRPGAAARCWCRCRRDVAG